jgi:uncharacterized protein YwqG
VSAFEDQWRAAEDLANQHLGPDAAEVLGLMRPAARLRHVADDGRMSRLGGFPVLPSGTEWPSWNGVPLSFLTLLDLEELAGFRTDLALPSEGLLNFFYEAQEQDAWGFDPADAGAWRVILTDLRTGQITEPPADGLTFDVVSLQSEQTLTAPGWEESVVESVLRRDRDAYMAFSDAIRDVAAGEAAPCHQVGGWPNLVQAPFWTECQLASNGVFASGDSRRTDQARALAQEANRWRMLLQLDSDDDAGWMWGDVGMLYFAMRDEDIHSGGFDLAWMTFQCC